ncbi:TPA: phage morphogenesis protein [Clostridium botulinum]|uniref:hypothetical protein n=1 Tax=Clostridium botulinum TaxID=1491 RepID=UPI000466C626|nr:hypothetical protein [Clostridium botulinum]APR02571.1 putative phage virion protein [Clostridium botulinum]AUN01625.1 phage morphogenesis protein [Clostridium botulinum]MBN3359346.1 phage morphogenesis protein [Clostridium botulinum]MBN3367175.1 phage morphogenesis protein [Clostridium botulinum]MBN3371808.1 phage morphogenesis protein [Clostridium botulinum]
MEIKNFDKLLEMGKRIYNNKMVEEKDRDGKLILSDENMIKKICQENFSSNGEIKTLEGVRSFNKLIVEVANEEADAKIKPILDAISEYAKVGRYDKKIYTIDKKARISMALSATASGVDFVRVSPYRKTLPAQPEDHQFGVYYNIERMITDPVNEFRNAVNLVQEEKIKYLFKKVMELTRKGKTLNKIPAKQTFDAANMTLVNFRDIENRLLRYGRGVRPVLVADINLIDNLAMKQGTENNNFFLTKELREELLRDTNISQISRSIAIATDNPFVDDLNSKVDLPVNEGIMIAGGSKSPFKITEFGGLRTAQDMPSIENESVYLKIDYRVNVELLLGQAMGYIKDTAVSTI